MKSKITNILLHFTDAKTPRDLISHCRVSEEETAKSMYIFDRTHYV